MNIWRLRFRGSASPPPAPLPTITGTPAGTAYVGEPYSFVPVGTGEEPLTFALEGTLPDGLEFDSATGTITGTPT